MSDPERKLGHKSSAAETVGSTVGSTCEKPEDPHNWSTSRKWVNVMLIAAQATLSPIASSLLAVGALKVDKEFHVHNSYISALPVAFFVLGLGLGPLYLAPLSEMYGRRVVYIVSFALFSLFNVGCALANNMAALVVLRLLAGLAGSAGPSLGGGTIGDMFTREERGSAQAIYGFGPTFGPVIGGLIGGFISDHAGWRWLMWIMAISSGFTTIISVFFLRETYMPYLVAKSEGRRSSNATIGFKQSITRPIRMLFTAPIVTTMSLYMSLIYGVLYLQIITIPLLFGPVPLFGLFTYGWQDGDDGLAYLGPGLGCFLSTVTCIFTLNRTYRALCKRYGDPKPEYRMPMMQLGMLIVPGGLFMYGWSAEAHVHYIIPLLGVCIFAYGMLITYVCIQTYLVDSFTDYAASALASAIVLRSIFGAVFSIIGVQLYDTLGYGWGTTLLALICVAALPIPYLFWKYGERLRAKPFLA